MTLTIYNAGDMDVKVEKYMKYQMNIFSCFEATQNA